MRHTLRLFARTPLASAAALGALALAIGASTLVFSVVDGILLQPLSYQGPRSLSWSSGRATSATEAWRTSSPPPTSSTGATGSTSSPT